MLISSAHGGLRCSRSPALRRLFSSTPTFQAEYTHVVIGAGVVGLAIAQRLADRRKKARTLLLDRRARAGTDASSRNSGVVHAGLYYPADSLKGQLCWTGRRLLYPLCFKRRIPVRRTAKWIVAQDQGQADALVGLHRQAHDYGWGAVPTHFIPLGGCRVREPWLRAEAAVLESFRSGIVDAHAFMDYLEGHFRDHGGETAYGAEVAAIEQRANGSFTVRTRTPRDVAGAGADTAAADPPEPDGAVTTDTVINSAGLGAIPVANMLLPAARRATPSFARGTYFAYSAPSPKPKVLVYPAPQPGLGGLGTHLTIDTGDPPRVRFGPDVEWVDYDPVRHVVRGADGREEAPYTPNRTRMAAAVTEIKKYFPDLQEDALDVDYCGIRAKISRDPGGTRRPDGFEDFVIRKEAGFGGAFINLMGIESPGLTASLAIAERVDHLLYK